MSSSPASARSPRPRRTVARAKTSQPRRGKEDGSDSGSVKLTLSQLDAVYCTGEVIDIEFGQVFGHVFERMHSIQTIMKQYIQMRGDSSVSGVSAGRRLLEDFAIPVIAFGYGGQVSYLQLDANHRVVSILFSKLLQYFHGRPNEIITAMANRADFITRINNLKIRVRIYRCSTPFPPSFSLPFQTSFSSHRLSLAQTCPRPSSSTTAAAERDRLGCPPGDMDRRAPPHRHPPVSFLPPSDSPFNSPSHLRKYDESGILRKKELKIKELFNEPRVQETFIGRDKITLTYFARYISFATLVGDSAMLLAQQQPPQQRPAPPLQEPHELHEPEPLVHVPRVPGCPHQVPP